MIKTIDHIRLVDKWYEIWWQEDGGKAPEVGFHYCCKVYMLLGCMGQNPGLGHYFINHGMRGIRVELEDTQNQHPVAVLYPDGVDPRDWTGDNEP